MWYVRMSEEKIDYKFWFVSSFEHHWSNHLVEQEDNDYDVVLHVAEAVACVTVVTVPGN